MSAPDPKPLIGTSLPGYYHVERLIGAGAFAWVFYATNAADEGVAVKVLKEPNNDGRKLFTREIKIMRALPQSERCVHYIADGETREGAPFLVMEYVDGITLKDGLKFKPVWDETEACELMLQLCDAFQGLHRLGVAHRDLKPENIMLTRDWQVKLMDFGLVKDAQGLLKLFESEDILKGKDFAENLDKAMLAGTPEYMSPEQFSDPLVEDEALTKTDTWTDVYSLGLVFYQLLVGAKLFPLTGPVATQADFSKTLIAYIKARTSFRDDMLQRPGNITPELWSIIARSLRMDPRARQGTAGDLAREIRHFVETGEGVDGFEDMTSTTNMADLLALNPDLLTSRDKAMEAIARAQASSSVRMPVPKTGGSMRSPPPDGAPAAAAPAPGGSVRAPLDVAAIQAATFQEMDTLTGYKPRASSRSSPPSAISPDAKDAAKPAIVAATTGRPSPRLGLWVAVFLASCADVAAILARAKGLF